MFLSQIFSKKPLVKKHKGRKKTQRQTSECILEFERLLIRWGVIYAWTETENLFTLLVYGGGEITNGLIKEMEPDNAKERSPQSMTYWSCKSGPHRKLF